MMAFGGLSAPARVCAESSALEEVIVTAERRESTLQNTAVSVTTRTGDELAAQGRFTTRQILEDVAGITGLGAPALDNTGQDVQGNSISIRGVSSPATTPSAVPGNIAAAPATAVYVDGVFEGIGSNYDIDRVEVLRGPQGTLYGRSATAGVVALHTRNPTFDGFGGDVSAEIGNYELRHYGGAVNAPVSDTFALRLAADYRDQSKGYYGQARGYVKETTSGRIKALWQPNESFSLLAGAAVEQNDTNTGGRQWSGTSPASPSAPQQLTLTQTENPVYPGEKDFRQYWAELNWDMGAVTLTYQPAYRTWTQDERIFAVSDFIGSGASVIQHSQTPSDHFQTHELRLASNGDSKLRWQTGAFYYDNSLTSKSSTALYYQTGAQAGSIFDVQDRKGTESVGIFGEGTLSFTDAWRLTTGVRYDDTQVTLSEQYLFNQNFLCGTLAAPNPAICTGPALPVAYAAFNLQNVKLTFHNFNYKVRLEHDLTPVNLMYAMVSTGFRPGDAGVTGNPPAVPLGAYTVAPEKLTAYEIGSKNRFLDDTLQLNAGLYFYKYRGFITSYFPDTPDPFDPNNPAGAVGLSAPAENFGGELELLYQRTERDRLGVSYSYAQSRWVDRDPAFARAMPERDRAIIPHQYTANYEHRFSLPAGSTFTARVDARYIPSYQASNWHVDYINLGILRYADTDDQTIVNLTGTWVSAQERYFVSAYVRNVFDKQYWTSNNVAQIIPPNQFQIASFGFADPRVYGVVLSAHF